MKELPFLILILLLSLWAKRSFAQVSISPEIGFSRAPFALYGANSFDDSKSFDLFYGINGQAKITDRFSANVRISYVEREDLSWQDLCICVILNDSYEHNDLNLDLDVVYTLKNGFSFGVGPSLIRKINTIHSRNYKDGSSTERVFNDSYLALNGFLAYSYQRMTLKTMYVRRFEPDNLVFQYTEGISRFDFSINYAVFGSRNKNK
jgi:hypothetical protein